MVTRTINQIHFEDLDPIRFEELILAMVYRMKCWENLDYYGKKGSDVGINIRGIERLENNKERTYYFQCKWSLTNAQITDIYDEYLLKNTYIPDFYFLVVSCAVTKKQIDFFSSYGKDRGFKTVQIWTSSIIETKLYAEYHDLLFAYFGINLTSERNKIYSSIRRDITLKKKMKNDFLKQVGYANKDEMKEGRRNPHLKFVSREVLIRSIYDKAYPENTLLNNNFTGYYIAEIYDFYHNGLMVWVQPNSETIKYKFNDNDSDTQEIVEEQVDIIGCIPYYNIIVYDMDGDEYHNFPHLFCDFVNVTDPYEKLVYRSRNGYFINEDEIIRD